MGMPIEFLLMYVHDGLNPKADAHRIVDGLLCPNLKRYMSDRLHTRKIRTHGLSAITSCTAHCLWAQHCAHTVRQHIHTHSTRRCTAITRGRCGFGRERHPICVIAYMCDAGDTLWIQQSCSKTNCLRTQCVPHCQCTLQNLSYASLFTTITSVRLAHGCVCNHCSWCVCV